MATSTFTQLLSSGGRPGLPIPDSPYGLCGRTATLNKRTLSELRSRVKYEVVVLGSPVPDSPYGLCGRKATLNSLSTNRLLPFTVPR